MSAGGGAALDEHAAPGPRLERVDLEGDDGAVEQEDEPADRAAERERPAAVLEPRVPAHALGEREAAEHRSDEPGNDLGRRTARRLLHEPQVELGGLGGVLGALDELLDRDAVLLREAERGTRPLPRRVLRHLDRGAPHRLLTVGLAGRDVGLQREPPRRVEDDDARGIEPLAAGGLGEARRELLGEARQPRRGHLLEADLQQKLSHAPPPPRRLRPESRLRRTPSPPRRRGGGS